MSVVCLLHNFLYVCLLFWNHWIFWKPTCLPCFLYGKVSLSIPQQFNRKLYSECFYILCFLLLIRNARWYQLQEMLYYSCYWTLLENGYKKLHRNYKFDWTYSTVPVYSCLTATFWATCNKLGWQWMEGEIHDFRKYGLGNLMAIGECGGLKSGSVTSVHCKTVQD